MIVDGPEIWEHPEPLAKMVGLLVTMALESGATKLTLHLNDDRFELYVVMEGERIDLKPPPFHLSKWLPDVVKAIAGPDLSHGCQLFRSQLTVRYPATPPDDWHATVEVSYTEGGYEITFSFFEDRELYWTEVNRIKI